MKKRIIFFTILIAVFIALMAITAALTIPVIPADSIGMLDTYTRNKPDAEITVAIISDGNVTYKAYGKGAKEIEVPERGYEIGSITTTFTGVMMSRAVGEERVRLKDKVSDHVVLNTGTYAPSIFELVTHTSAYGSYPGYSKLKYNSGKNPFTGTDYPGVITIMDDFRLNQTPPYLYCYSDFGATVAGIVLEDSYGVEYFSILESFLKELGMENTYVAISKDAAVENGWIWLATDEYISSYGLTSTAADMAKYAMMYLSGDNQDFLRAVTPLVEVNMENNIGYFWGIGLDGIVRKTGTTASYACAVNMDIKNRNGVIVMSNYPNDRFGNVGSIADCIMNESFS